MGGAFVPVGRDGAVLCAISIRQFDVAFLATFVHLAMSSRMYVLNCSGVIGMGSSASLDSRSRSAGSLSAVVDRLV